MCIQDNPRYIELVKKGWLRPTVDICFEYGYTKYKLWDVYVDETFGLENDLQFWSSAARPEEALNRLFSSIEAWYAPSC